MLWLCISLIITFQSSQNFEMHSHDGSENHKNDLDVEKHNQLRGEIIYEYRNGN